MKNTANPPKNRIHAQYTVRQPITREHEGIFRVFSRNKLLLFRYEAGYKTIGDGGTNPYFGKHIIRILVLNLKEENVEVIEHRYQCVNGKDGP